jgi:hypothetical protein
VMRAREDITCDCEVTRLVLSVGALVAAQFKFRVTRTYIGAILILRFHSKMVPVT